MALWPCPLNHRLWLTVARSPLRREIVGTSPASAPALPSAGTGFVGKLSGVAPLRGPGVLSGKARRGALRLAGGGPRRRSLRRPSSHLDWTFLL